MNDEKNKKTFYTYLDCLRGDFNAPASKKEGLLFQTLFALTMAAVMVPCVNMILVGNPVSQSLKLLVTVPFWFCIAFFIRSAFANKLAFWLQAHFVTPRFQGIPSVALFVLINVCIMAPIMCACGTAFGIYMSGAGWGAFLVQYLHMLPRAAVLAYAIVFFVVKPTVSLVFSDFFKPAIGKWRAARSAN